ncbi:hypothetical protein NP233_g7080 [Leucocoprinus birnbaumii]|uniref:DH domain-containing protein n=1 Tax=Leucocoprinus birnbaumii TaxID=56174 RepID=A0AAD5VS94_9AGAR|nr:hypothetical protein NP233_g7080 [Leucocoprinus birnbaumii]
MEVLPPPSQFPTSLPPALFSERRNTVSHFPGTPPLPASPSQTAGIPVRFARCPSPARITTGGFLPLPTIAASPICSSTPSFRPSSTDSLQPSLDTIANQSEQLMPAKSNGRLEDKTPPNSQTSLRVLFAAPTWISTPPTPPHKHIRNLSTYDSWRPSSPVSPSASFPASTPPHAMLESPKTRLKRCLSVPTMSPRSRTISVPTLNFESLPKPLPSEANTLGKEGGHRPGRSRALFHIPKDNDDGSSADYAPSVVELSPGESCEGHGLTVNMQSREMKDAIRVFHALQELLSTEIDYVKDLRVMLIAYIQRLGTFEVRTSAFARASASFSTGPWVNAYAGQTLSPTDGLVPSTSSTSMRPIFSENEIKLITRNLRDILRLHEDFICSLRRIVASFGLTDALSASDSPRSELELCSALTSAVEAVSKKFITEAPKFEAYQTLCAGHPEAMNLIRRMGSQYPAEWETFEQRCWTTITKLGALSESHHIFDLSRNKNRTELLDVPSGGQTEYKRRRTVSAVNPAPSLTTQPTKEQDVPADPKQQRLAFADYLIKPVQRICKYPLLLQQLMPKKSFEPGEVTIAISDAIQVMRDVASSVDEARRRREVITKSSLIISRFALPPSSPNPSTVSPTSPALTLTPAFLSSLGPCLLSGTLDVMYYTPRRSFGHLQTITAKYLGIFLYSGGYLILAKIHKGKRYEPRHWFSLANFEMDVDSEEAMLPCSFRLSSRTIHFEFAAACQRERDIWIEAISNSKEHESTWCNEPLPSFKAVGKGIRPGDLRTDGLTPTSSAHAVPGASDTEVSTPSIRRRKLTLRKSDTAALQDQSRQPNRRSSTASIKSIFTPMGHDPNSIYINRSLLSGRLLIDHELHDVASQVCLSARLQATLHDEALFPQPSKYAERSGFSRSHSAISVAGLAKNRLSKQESLRVPRRKPRCDSVTTVSAQPLPEVPPLPLSARRSGKRLSLQTLPPRQSITTPAPLSAMSTTSGYNTPLTAPAAVSAASNPLSRPSSPLSLTRRGSNTFVRSVKGLFTRSGQSSPQSPSHLRTDDIKKEQPSTPPLLRRLTLRKSLRRRARSVAPDDPERPVSR